MRRFQITKVSGISRIRETSRHARLSNYVMLNYAPNRGVDQRVAQLPFCTRCGAKGGVSDEFCRKCGTPLNSKSSLRRIVQPIDFAIKGRQDSRRKLAKATILVFSVLFLASLLLYLPQSPAVSSGYSWVYLLIVAIAGVTLLLGLRELPYRISFKSGRIPASVITDDAKKLDRNRTDAGSPKVTYLRETKNLSTQASPKPALLQPTMENIRRLQEAHASETRKSAGTQRLIIVGCVVLLALGALALGESIVLSSQSLTFIGLGLTFLGFMFLYVRPSGYARKELVDSTALPSLQTIDRMIYELGFNGRGIYAPSSKGAFVFVPAERDSTTLPQKRLDGESVFSSNPKGLLILPPGLELAKMLREQLAKGKEPLSIEVLQQELPRILTEKLEIMRDFEMKVEGDRVVTNSTGSLYADFCNEIKLKTRVCSAFGCPMCSAIACLLVDATGNPVVLEEDTSTADGNMIQSTYRLLSSSSSTEQQNSGQTAPVSHSSG